MYLSNGRLYFLPSKHIYGSRHSANVVHLSFSCSFHSFSPNNLLKYFPGLRSSNPTRYQVTVRLYFRLVRYINCDETKLQNPNQTCIQSEFLREMNGLKWTGNFLWFCKTSIVASSIQRSANGCSIHELSSK